MTILGTPQNRWGYTSATPEPPDPPGPEPDPTGFVPGIMIVHSTGAAASVFAANQIGYAGNWAISYMSGGSTTTRLWQVGCNGDYGILLIAYDTADQCTYAARSTDGLTWTLTQIPGFVGVPVVWVDIAWTGTYYLIIGHGINGDATPYLLRTRGGAFESLTVPSTLSTVESMAVDKAGVDCIVVTASDIRYNRLDSIEAGEWASIASFDTIPSPRYKVSWGCRSSGQGLLGQFVIWVYNSRGIPDLCNYYIITHNGSDVPAASFQNQAGIGQVAAFNLSSTYSATQAAAGTYGANALPGFNPIISSRVNDTTWDVIGPDIPAVSNIGWTINAYSEALNVWMAVSDLNVLWGTNFTSPINRGWNFAQLPFAASLLIA